MQFRPCIDIHNGKVKQIVGGSLSDLGNQAVENFVAEQDAAFYARLYREKHIRGGHVILLNKAGTPEYQRDIEQAGLALSAYPGGLQLGGGITADNAVGFLAMGASHVIVTSYVFCAGRIDYDRLALLQRKAGREHLVLDLSCRKRDGRYYIVTDRWQKFTDEAVSKDTILKLQDYADEFLIHAVDVEGKAGGVERELVEMLGEYADIPITYAGGVGSYEDIEVIRRLGKNRLNVTIGSALDLFGGSLDFNRVISMMDKALQAEEID
ncbi:MAG: phosphoribosylformimino-5-aminoimidazole carboxamide ribotide isomerase [Bacteroidales bacterium]|nr:phosphoribosylformimino-5-aminoimidazole carboxamide ribotide isomerase [Clostridium sp.]MCM1204306.1 phosphoribosylformimino-5-aminoimidazole carboxamide ribotide isomerase [Bacteroidales bacterium]